MTPTRLRRAAARLAASAGAVALAVLLSGCMLASDENFLAGEAVPITEGDVLLFNYEPTADGYVLTGDEPSLVEYFAVDHSYGSANGDQPVYFIPYDGDDRYIVAVAWRRTHYALARLRGGLIEIRAVHQGDVAAEVAAAGRTIPDGVTIDDDDILVPDRAALGTMLEYIADGTVSTEPRLSWIGSGEPPARLIPEAGWYAPAP